MSSKRVTVSQAEHFARIEGEFGESPMKIIREMYEDGIALRVIAGALDVPGDTLMGWVRRWGWNRPDIGRDRPNSVYNRVTNEWGHDAIALVCSDRKMGMKYHEIAARYNITNPTIIKWLRIGAPWIVGTKMEPIQVAPPTISAKERARRSAACVEHNKRMCEERRGWFVDHWALFRSRETEKTKGV
jgi:uncharacterized protein YjcR